MGRSLMVGLVFFAIFVAGIITGGFLMARWVRINQAHWQKMNQQQQQQNIVVPIGPMMVKQMLNQLDLNRDQRKAANKILFENATVVRVLRSETDFALNRMQEDIDSILTPDQREALGQLKDMQRAKLLEQREAVQNFLKQRHGGEAAPASGGKEQSSPPSPAAAAPAQPAPAPAATQTQPASAH